MERNKILIAIGFLVVIIFGGLFLVSAQNNMTGLFSLFHFEETEETIIFGAVGHFTGNYAVYGAPMLNAVQLAVEEVNDRGGVNGKKILLIAEDDVGNPNQASTAINKLINIDGAKYIFSAQGSSMVSVVSPVAQNNQRLLMITLGSAPKLTEVGEYVFRSTPSDTYQGFEMKKLIQELEAKKIAGLYLNDAYGKGIIDLIKTSENKAFVADEVFEPNSTDFRIQLTKIKNSNPDVLVIVAHQEYSTILRQMREIGLELTVITSETFMEEKTLSEIKVPIEGIFSFKMLDTIDHVNFSKKYVERFQEEPSIYSKYAYDGAIAIIKALEQTEDPNNIEQTIKELYKTEFNGASSKVGFNEKGDRKFVKYEVYIIQNGKPTKHQ